MDRRGRVTVIPEEGMPVEYRSVSRVATEYRIAPETVLRYIKSGKLYKRGRVFFDWAVEERKDTIG